MSLVAIAAGKDTRGVTTTALALAAVWPSSHPVLLAECDPSGGSLAARFGLPTTPGVVSLASAGRHQLSPGDVGRHTQLLPNGGLRVLVGFVRAEQAHALGRLWSTLAATLAQLDGDVIADCGRLGPDSPTSPILQHADLVVLVCDPTREGILHLQGRIEALANQGITPGVVLLGETPYSAAEVRGLLAAGGHGQVVGVLASDPAAAALLAGHAGRARNLARSLLIRSARELAGHLHAHLLDQPLMDQPAAAATVEVEG
jgi:MinD-like ATPase involved in chromosome partitioning or flagellar assembly